jgi:hypothetical protein
VEKKLGFDFVEFSTIGIEIDWNLGVICKLRHDFTWRWIKKFMKVQASDESEGDDLLPSPFTPTPSTPTFHCKHFIKGDVIYERPLQNCTLGGGQQWRNESFWCPGK